MTNYKAMLAILIFVGSALLSPAANAEPVVDVDIAAPFTKNDLSEAISLRHVNGSVDHAIHVGRLSENRFVVTVDDRAQIVELTSTDRTTSARVVALVVVALLPRATAPHVETDDAPTFTSKATQETSRWSNLAYRASLSLSRDDNGYEVPVLSAGGAYSIAANANIVATAGISQNNDYLDTSSLLFPVRLGLEGRAGAAGVEIGGQQLFYRENTCDDWGAQKSVYGVARVFLPIGGSKKMTLEMGGQFVLDEDPTRCLSASNFTAYGGWVGVGAEWK